MNKYLILLFISLILYAKKSTDLYLTGRITYNAACISCHNADPRQEGIIGPALAESSEELIQSKAMYGMYPPDYKPKRNTKIMPIFEHLTKEQIKGLYLFLNDINCDGKGKVCKVKGRK